jgi:crossover junction endodeoxyribonuclease RuvC
LRILGLDPGSLHTGYGLIEKKGSRLQALAHGRISLAKSQPVPIRLATLSSRLQDLLKNMEPDCAAMEGLFHGVNPRSLIVLAQARGVLLATLAGSGLEVAELAPAQIKSAVAGNGRADKSQVEHMVRLILGLGKVALSPDAADALAVGICYAQRRRMDRLESAQKG